MLDTFMMHTLILAHPVGELREEREMEAMIDFSDLETPADQIETKKSKIDRPTFPCMKCNGTGVFTWGYYNPQSGKCHACNGRGWGETDTSWDNSPFNPKWSWK